MGSINATNPTISTYGNGTLTITPTSSGTLTFATSGPTFKAITFYVNDVLPLINQVSFTSGVLFSIEWSIPPSNIVLQLPFDNETSSIAYDWSGTNNNGIITGATKSYDGHYGMSLSFAGNDYVTVIDDGSLDFTTSIIMSAWIKPISITADGIIFDKPNTYGLYLTSGGGISMMINNIFYNTSNSLITANTRYHITGEYTGATINIYINEVNKKTASLSDAIIPSAFDLIIGDQFVGNLDEIMLMSESYSELLDPIANYPYVYNCYLDVATGGLLVPSISYNFTNVYIQENSTYPIIYTKFNFTDGISELGLEWFTPSTFTTHTGIIGNQSAKITFISNIYTLSNNAIIIYSKLKTESVINTTAITDVILTCTDSIGRIGNLLILDRFSIYGIGGSTTYQFVGDGSAIAGGSLLDVMAMNSSLTSAGSSAYASIIETNFQHVSMLVHIYQDTVWASNQWVEPSVEHNTAWAAFGVDYMYDNETWASGWYVNITVADGLADESNGWVRLNCSWYNAGQYIKSDTVYSMYEAYRANDTTTQFTLYIDFWLSANAGNSQVGGHVSSMYYGMSKTGWWLWSNWGPVGGLATSSTFTDYLYDKNGDVTTTSVLSTFRIWDQITKSSPGTGYSDACLWAIQVESLQIRKLPPNAVLVGIISPIFQPTTTPDMPVGFFAQLGNFLGGTMSLIQYGISTLAASGYAMTAGALDSVASQFGITDFTTSISSFLGGISSFFTTSVDYIIDIITTFFTLLASIGIFIITWFGGFITAIINIGAGVTSIFNGTSSLMDAFQVDILTQVWAIFGGPTGLIASGAIFIFLAIWWFDSIDQRAKRFGGGWTSIFMGDIQNMISIFSFILDLSWRVVTTVIDLSMRFINIFT